MEKNCELLNKKKIFFLFFPILGALIIFISSVLDIKIDLFQLRIRPLHLAILVLWFGCIECLVRKMIIFEYTFIGASFALVVGYYINQGSLFGNFADLKYYLAAGLAGSILVLPGIHAVENGCFRKKSMKWAVSWLLLSTGVVLLFRITNIANRDLPNEARSLIINGVEIHHFISGFLIVGFALVLLINFVSSGFVQSFFSGLLVIGLGMIADQITYIFMFPLTDDAFFSIFSLLGAVISMTWLCFRLIHLIKRSV